MIMFVNMKFIKDEPSDRLKQVSGLDSAHFTSMNIGQVKCAGDKGK